MATTATASQAGVNKVLVYRYFRSWNGLLETLFAQLLSEINLRLGTGPGSGRIDALVAQEAYVLTFSQLVKDTPAFWVLLYWQMDRSKAVLGTRLTELLNESMYQVAGSDMANVEVLQLLIAGVTGPTSSHELTERAIRHLFAQLRLVSQCFDRVVVAADGYLETVFMR